MLPKNKGKDIKGRLKEFGQFQCDNVFVLLPNLNMDMPVQNHRTPCHVLKPAEMTVCDWVKLHSLVSIPLLVCHLDQVPFHSLSSSYLCLLPPYSSALPDSVTVLHTSSSFSSPTVQYKPLLCLSLTVLLPISLTLLLFFLTSSFEYFPVLPFLYFLIPPLFLQVLFPLSRLYTKSS